MKSRVRGSASASTTPGPPGTQIRSKGGAVSKVQLGTMARPRSLGTGSSVRAATWHAARGKLLATELDGGVASRLRTSNGPVKSSWVMPGKITKPTSKSGMLGILRAGGAGKSPRIIAPVGL